MCDLKMWFSFYVVVFCWLKFVFFSLRIANNIHQENIQYIPTLRVTSILFFDDVVRLEPRNMSEKRCKGELTLWFFFIFDLKYVFNLKVNIHTLSPKTTLRFVKCTSTISLSTEARFVVLVELSVNATNAMLTTRSMGLKMATCSTFFISYDLIVTAYVHLYSHIYMCTRKYRHSS